jgi:hypothetical protein
MCLFLSLSLGKNFENFTRSNVCARSRVVVSLSLFLSASARIRATSFFCTTDISYSLSLSLSLIINKQVTLNRQIHFLERVEEKYFKEEEEEEEEPETLIVPDSLAITTTNNNNNNTINNDGTEKRFTSAAAFRFPSIGATPKKKQQRTKTRVEEEEEYETMVVTNTQMTSSSPPPTAANATRRNRRKSSSSRSPLMEQAQNVAATNNTTTTPAATTNDETEDEVFKGRSLSPNAEFREAQKIAFNMSNEKKKDAKEMRRRRRKAESSYEDDEDEDNDEGFDLMKDNRNVNAYGETIRVADTLAMNTEYNRISPRKIITTATTAMAKQKSALNDSAAAAKKRRVDFQFGDRQTEEQEEEERMHARDTPIRETVPAPSGMHVNDDNDDNDEHHHNVEEIEEHEREEKRDENDDGSNDELPLREIFRAKHLIDPRDASQLAPILNVQVLRDESFANDETDHRDHYLAYEIDHEIRDATEISVWKIEDNRSDSSSTSGSDNTSDEERAMMKNGKDSSFKSTFRGTVLIGKPSDRDGISSTKKGNGKIKRWAYSVAPNGLVFTSLYTKSSLLSMDETERTHGSSSDDDDDMFDDEGEENYFSLDGSTSERRRTFPRKSGVYVHVPVDVNTEVQNDSLEKKSRRSSGRRRSSKRGASMMMGSGGSFPSSSAKEEEQKKKTYFELQSPGMAGKVHPRKFASAFSEEYDETVFRLAGVGAEGKCRLWTWSCDDNGFADDDSMKSKKTKKNRTKFATAKMCAKSVTSCKDFEIPTYKSHCVSRDCEITSLSFSKDGNILACVFDKKHVVVWDASTTRVIFSYYCTEYEIETDGLRVLDDAVDSSNRQKRKTSLTRKSSTPSRRSKSGFNAEATAGGRPIFFFGNFRKIPNASGDDESIDADVRKKSVAPSSPFSIATFACAYNKELVVGPNASWESPKNGDLVSGVAVCPYVFVEEEEEENDDDDDDDEEEEKKNNNAQEANKRNTTINVVVTNAGRLGAFEAFGHANEATDAYEGLTFTKQSAFEDISSDDADDDDTKSRGKKSRKTNFLCASHGKLFAIARRHPGCVSLYAQK